MSEKKIILITGSRKGIGLNLAKYYVNNGFIVIGCSRGESGFSSPRYEHFCLDISDEKKVIDMFSYIRKKYGGLNILLNNAGIASMNHSLLTTIDMARKIYDTNSIGTFLFCREAAKLMKKMSYGRIVNFSTVAVPMNLEGEAIYASSKAAIESLTKVLAKEFSSWNITVNAIGPTPIKTDLIKSIPQNKINNLISNQAIKRYGVINDIINVLNFFSKKESNFITGQIIYLGGI